MSETSTTYFQLLKETIQLFTTTLPRFSSSWTKVFVAIIMLAIVVLMARCAKKKSDDVDKEFIQIAIKLVLCVLLTIAYLLLLCAKVSSSYICRIDVQISWLFFAVLFGGICVAYILRKVSNAVYVVPLVLCLMFYSTVIDGNVYSESNMADGVDLETVRDFGDYIVHSVVTADKNGDTEIELRVPSYDSGDNWPLATYGGDRISNTVYLHGLTSKRMNIKFVPSGTIDDILNENK